MMGENMNLRKILNLLTLAIEPSKSTQHTAESQSIKCLEPRSVTMHQTKVRHYR